MKKQQKQFGLIAILLAALILPHLALAATPTGNGTVSITSPTNGSSAQPGDTITVQVAVTGTVNSVLIASSVDAEIIDKPPYQLSFKIPADYLGPLHISALGRDAGGILGSDDITVNVTTTATVKTISLTPNDYLPLALGQGYQIFATGVFSDGVSRNISSPQMGTIYESANPQIVSVDANGHVTANAPGTTTITARNGSATSPPLTAEVLVCTNGSCKSTQTAPATTTVLCPLGLSWDASLHACVGGTTTSPQSPSITSATQTQPTSPPLPPFLSQQQIITQLQTQLHSLLQQLVQLLTARLQLLLNASHY